MTTTTKKHRATQPLPATVRADLYEGGAHRSSRTGETILLVSLGTLLIAFAMVMTLRG